jgi:hypothetical protein
MNPLSRDNPTSKASLIFVLVLVSAVALVLHGSMTGAEWVDLMKWAAPAFSLAEAGRKFAKPAPAPGAV